MHTHTHIHSHTYTHTHTDTHTLTRSQGLLQLLHNQLQPLIDERLVPRVSLMLGPQHAHHLGVRMPCLLLPTEEVPCLGKAVLALTALLSLAATALSLAVFSLAGLAAADSGRWFRRLARRGTLGVGVHFGSSRSRLGLGLLLGFGGWGYVRHSG